MRNEQITEMQARHKFPQAQDRVAKVGDIYGSSPEEDLCTGYATEKEPGKNRELKWIGRDERQRQADEREVIPESTHNALTEESYQEKHRGRTRCAESHSDKGASQHRQQFRNLVQVYDGNVCQRHIGETTGH